MNASTSTLRALFLGIVAVAILFLLNRRVSSEREAVINRALLDQASPGGLMALSFRSLAGEEVPLARFTGRVLLIVNTASRCGLTPQYEALQRLHDRYADSGLVVIGFPCNQFLGQEPGSAEEIESFCRVNYGVTFLLADKIEVNGAGKHPIYAVLTGDSSPFPGKIGWNFTKFLIGRDGRIAARFEPRTKPDAPEIIAMIESLIAEATGGRATQSQERTDE
jgi:glutathione peroxidase